MEYMIGRVGGFILDGLGSVIEVRCPQASKYSNADDEETLFEFLRLMKLPMLTCMRLRCPSMDQTEAGLCLQMYCMFSPVKQTIIPASGISSLAVFPC